MKRLICLALFVIASANLGCMAVSASDHSRGVKDRHQVVAVGDKVYIIDTKTGDAREVDLAKSTIMTAEDRVVTAEKSRRESEN